MNTLGAMDLQQMTGKRDQARIANHFCGSPLTLPGINRRRFLRLTGVGALVSVAGFADGSSAEENGSGLFKASNLVAWCIVPFDAKKRGPEERARMLKDLGFTRLAYDWREEHIKTFDAELEALQRHGIQLTAFWFPGALNPEARIILDLLRRHGIKTQLWVTLGDPAPATTDSGAKVEAAINAIRPIAEAAAKIGCQVALYNHGDWFGEPENQLAILRRLKMSNTGIVYNLHHGHEHLDRFPELLAAIKPHLLALNLNGMVKDGDKTGRKILPLGQGDLDLTLIKAIIASGWQGPVGILNHTDEDAEARLKDNLEGLRWLVAQVEGKPAGARPTPRSWSPPAPPAATSTTR